MEELILSFKGNRNRIACGEDNINTEPVSYTHLDVYKRQV